MFFKNFLVFLFFKFLWAGLVLGIFSAFCKLVILFTRKNVYVYNVVNFCFLLLFDGVYAYLCMCYYNFAFCWFGLFGMILGLVLVKISLQFFFTKFMRLLYNKLTKLKVKRKNLNGKQFSAS